MRNNKNKIMRLHRIYQKKQSDANKILEELRELTKNSYSVIKKQYEGKYYKHVYQPYTYYYHIVELHEHYWANVIEIHKSHGSSTLRLDASIHLPFDCEPEEITEQEFNNVIKEMKEEIDFIETLRNKNN